MVRRALLTDGERDTLRNPGDHDNPYVAVSRIRKKIHDRLPEDVEILREYHPELLAELQEEVCNEETDG